MGKDSELLEAARVGNLATVEKILSSRSRKSGPLASLRRGPGVNVADDNGYTCLHHAALNGHQAIVCVLLRHEASPNMQDSMGSTALHLAAWAGHTAVVKVLLTGTIHVPTKVNHQNHGGETALHCAAQHGHTEVARLLLEHGGDPTLPNLKAETPLDLAAQYGRLDTAEQLIRTHPDLMRPYTPHAATAAVFPHTPLHRASRNGHLSIVKLLLNHGHHVNVRTSHGSPLHMAALGGKVDVVRALLDAGGDADVRNDMGHTVLDTIGTINTTVTKEIASLISSAATPQTRPNTQPPAKDVDPLRDDEPVNTKGYSVDFSTILSPSFFSNVGKSVISVDSPIAMTNFNFNVDAADRPGPSTSPCLSSSLPSEFTPIDRQPSSPDTRTVSESQKSNHQSKDIPDFPKDLFKGPTTTDEHPITSPEITNNLDKVTKVKKNYEYNKLQFEDLSEENEDENVFVSAEDEPKGMQLSYGGDGTSRKISNAAPVVVGRDYSDQDASHYLVMFKSSPTLKNKKDSTSPSTTPTTKVEGKEEEKHDDDGASNNVYEILEPSTANESPTLIKTMPMPVKSFDTLSSGVSNEDSISTITSISSTTTATTETVHEKVRETEESADNVYDVPRRSMPCPAFRFRIHEHDKEDRSSRPDSLNDHVYAVCEVYHSDVVDDLIDTTAGGDPDKVNNRPRTPPGYADPALLDSPYQNVILPTVLTPTPPRREQFPTKPQEPAPVVGSDENNDSDGEKYGRMPADRRSTCSSKTLDRPSHKGHDRSSSRSSEQFYATIKSTTSHKKRPSLIRPPSDEDRAVYKLERPRSSSQHHEATAYSDREGEGGTSSSGAAKRDRYRERLSDRSSVDNWLSDRGHSDRESRGSAISDRECYGHSDRDSQASESEYRVGGGGASGSEWSVGDGSRALAASQNSTSDSYDVPPPPRTVSHHRGQKSSPRPIPQQQGKPPPKPPRRSMCPSSPPASTGDELDSDVLMVRGTSSPRLTDTSGTSVGDTGGGGRSGSPRRSSGRAPGSSSSPRRSIEVTGVSNPNYEMMCFAESATNSSTAKRRSKHKSYRDDHYDVPPPPRQRGSSCSTGGGAKHRPLTSDSDSDHHERAPPHSYSKYQSSSGVSKQKGYTPMSFKPVKSRRTTRSSSQSYENDSATLLMNTSDLILPPSSPQPSAPPPTPMDKHSQPSNASPSSPKQKYKQKHHHSSPSLAAQASLSLPPPPLPPSGSTSIPPPLPPRACDATGSSNAPPSIPPSSSQQQQQPPTSSSAVFSSFSGYHINRISSAISKNTQQLFRSFSNITTNPTGNGSLASSGAKTIAKAFSKASSREDNLDQEEEGLNRGAAGADSLDGKGAGGVGGAPTSAASMDDMLVRGEDSGLNNGGGPYDDHRPRDLELPSSVTPGRPSSSI